jgi:hypothetical protein
MPDPQIKTWKSKTGVRVLSLVVYGLALALWAMRGPERYRTVAVAVIAACGALWIADVFLTRIVVYDDRIFVWSMFQRRNVLRSQITSVTWEKGAGAYLRLQDGSSVKLPQMGKSYQSQVNSIRAWLKRTAPDS